MGILELIIILLVIMWVLGLATSVGGSLVHLLLVIALIVLIVRLVRGGRVV